MSDTDMDQGPEPGSEEYNQQMIEMHKQRSMDNPDAVGDPEEEPVVAEIPEGGYEEFFNAETGEYDWRAHAQWAESAEAEEGDEGSEEEYEVTYDNAGAVVEAAGLSAEDLSDQIAETGDISAEARKALNEQGYSDDVINTIRDQHVALVSERRANAVEYAGGEDATQELLQWAKDNLAQEEKDAYNNMLASENWRYAIDAIGARMEASAKDAGEGTLIQGDAASSGAVGYTSKAQMKLDMADPRYSMDPAFRREVMVKIQKANWSDDQMGMGV